MTSVTISPKFQVVIPREVRQSMHLKPGQKVQVVKYEGRIELILVREMSEMQGFLKGMDATINREEDRI